MSDQISPTMFNFVSQCAHFFCGATVFLTIGMFNHRWQIYMIPIGILAAGLKEFVYDAKYENTATRGSGLKDFIFYCLGITFAAIVRIW